MEYVLVFATQCFILSLMASGASATFFPPPMMGFHPHMGPPPFPVMPHMAAAAHHHAMKKHHMMKFGHMMPHPHPMMHHPPPMYHPPLMHFHKKIKIMQPPPLIGHHSRSLVVTPNMVRLNKVLKKHVLTATRMIQPALSTSGRKPVPKGKSKKGTKVPLVPSGKKLAVGKKPGGKINKGAKVPVGFRPSLPGLSPDPQAIRRRIHDGSRGSMLRMIQRPTIMNRWRGLPSNGHVVDLAAFNLVGGANTNIQRVPNAPVYLPKTRPRLSTFEIRSNPYVGGAGAGSIMTIDMRARSGGMHNPPKALTRVVGGNIDPRRQGIVDQVEFVNRNTDPRLVKQAFRGGFRAPHDRNNIPMQDTIINLSLTKDVTVRRRLIGRNNRGGHMGMGSLPGPNYVSSNVGAKSFNQTVDAGRRRLGVNQDPGQTKKLIGNKLGGGIVGTNKGLKGGLVDPKSGIHPTGKGTNIVNNLVVGEHGTSIGKGLPHSIVSAANLERLFNFKSDPRRLNSRDSQGLNVDIAAQTLNDPVESRRLGADGIRTVQVNDGNGGTSSFQVQMLGDNLDPRTSNTLLDKPVKLNKMESTIH